MVGVAHGVRPGELFELPPEGDGPRGELALEPRDPIVHRALLEAHQALQSPPGVRRMEGGGFQSTRQSLAHVGEAVHPPEVALELPKLRVALEEAHLLVPHHLPRHVLLHLLRGAVAERVLRVRFRV